MQAQASSQGLKRRTVLGAAAGLVTPFLARAADPVTLNISG